ncbi:threonylcarbamoyl-AMP synthase [Bacteroidia bacterium]|nr:threonylcarbamoyl-AMP synthase [Bacteroidia bacterium]
MYINPNLFDKIRTHLLGGGIIAFPTDTVWGLGVLPEFANNLFELKQRPRDKHFVIMSDSVEHLSDWMLGFSDTAVKLLQQYTPGALTVIGNDDPLFGGIRVPYHPVFAEICSNAVPGYCLATSSANISGRECAQSESDIANIFPKILIVPDFGIKPAGTASTVVKVIGDEIKILRGGQVSI